MARAGWKGWAGGGEGMMLRPGGGMRVIVRVGGIGVDCLRLWRCDSSLILGVILALCLGSGEIIDAVLGSDFGFRYFRWDHLVA